MQHTACPLAEGLSHITACRAITACFEQVMHGARIVAHDIGDFRPLRFLVFRNLEFCVKIADAFFDMIVTLRHRTRGRFRAGGC